MLYEIPRYPAEMIDVLHLRRAGVAQRVVVRPVLPQDAAPTSAFFAGLSSKARYDRFMAPVRELSQGLVERFTRIDYQEHLALVAEVYDGNQETVIGEVRYVRDGDGLSAEFAVTVAEDWQGLGLARTLLGKLICRATADGVRTLRGQTLATNAAMMHLARKAGFLLRPDPDLRGVMNLERVLEAAPTANLPCTAAA